MRRLPFVLFETIDTEKIGGIAGSERERGDASTTAATSPISLDARALTALLTRTS